MLLEHWGAESQSPPLLTNRRTHSDLRAIVAFTCGGMPTKITPSYREWAMKAAIVAQAGSMPVYGDFKEPAPSSGEISIAVTAAALSPW